MRRDNSATLHDIDQLSMLDEEPAKPKKLKPTKRCPIDFQITPELRAWAAEKAPDVDINEETEAVKDHEFFAARCDWNGVWRNWMRKAQKEALRFKPRNQKAPQPERQYLSAEDLENRIIERSILAGQTDQQIWEKLELVPIERIRAKRRELQPTEH